ncbi:hypothetical protein ACHAW5_000431 [Stephanodiscus triporus]|uniref:S-formylglutathione hydrolase n=1 Tax=Stephanodiscus triporus TaxID=2934178 RepID=A0ABD3MJS3_9STRA
MAEDEEVEEESGAPYTILSTQRVDGGSYHRISHPSSSTGVNMTFGLFVPARFASCVVPYDEEEEARKAKSCASFSSKRRGKGSIVPVMFWLSGMTCDDTTFAQQAGSRAFPAASREGIAIVMPDTSPRGDDDDDPPVPDAVGRPDLGKGAGFYVDATEPPWSRHYRMHSYVSSELPSLLERYFGIGEYGVRSICGHAMGGHGALTIALKDPTGWAGVSALSPVCNPTSPRCEWGRRAFDAYLGGVDAGRAHDATVLILGLKSRSGPPFDDILIDYGTEDEFLDQLSTKNFVEAATFRGQSVTCNARTEYDHSYHFVSAYIADHVMFHGVRLRKKRESSNVSIASPASSVVGFSMPIGGDFKTKKAPNPSLIDEYDDVDVDDDDGQGYWDTGGDAVAGRRQSFPDIDYGREERDHDNVGKGIGEGDGMRRRAVQRRASMIPPTIIEAPSSSLHKPQERRASSFSGRDISAPTPDNASGRGIGRDSFEIRQTAIDSIVTTDETLRAMSVLKNIEQNESHLHHWQGPWRSLAERASPPETPTKELIRRSAFLAMSTMTVGAGLVWSLMYVALGEYLAALMPVIYSACMGTTLFICVFRPILIFVGGGGYDFVVKAQLGLILILPFAVHVALGGVERSGGVMLWSFLCPVGAAFFRSTGEGLRWFQVYMCINVILLTKAFWDVENKVAGEDDRMEEGNVMLNSMIYGPLLDGGDIFVDAGDYSSSSLVDYTLSTLAPHSSSETIRKLYFLMKHHREVRHFRRGISSLQLGTRDGIRQVGGDAADEHPPKVNSEADKAGRVPDSFDHVANVTILFMRT